jgi:hypothetical protein
VGAAALCHVAVEGFELQRSSVEGMLSDDIAAKIDVRTS